MATMSVRMPDGTVIDNIPEGTPKAQLEDKLRANNMWRSEWDVAPTEQSTPAQVAPSTPPPTPNSVDPDAKQWRGNLNKILQGASFGFSDEILAGLSAPALAGISQLTDNPRSIGQMYSEARDLMRDDMQLAEENSPATALAAEIGGGLLTGGALVSMGKKAAPKAMQALANYASRNPRKAGAALGGVTGGLYGLGTAEGDDRVDSALEAGLIGVPFGFAGGALSRYLSGRGVGAGGDDVARGVSAQAPLSVFSRGTQSADDAARVLTPEQMERAKILEAVGVKNPTAAMVSRDPATWQFERNTAGIQGVGDRIRQRYVESNQAIQEALRDLGKMTKGKASTAYEAGESVVDAVTNKNREMQRAVGDLYSNIRKYNLVAEGLRPQRIMDALDEASDNAYADNIVNSVTRKMKRYGLIDGTGNYQEGQVLTVPQAEELRKFINSLRGDRQTEHIVSNIIDALDDDVIETAGDDAFRVARDAARNRFREFESKLLGGISEGKIVSDDVLKKTVLGGKVKDVEALKNSLLRGTDDQVMRGSQAWNDLKMQTVQNILDTAVGSNGKLSGTSLKRQLERIGKERLETIFDPEELMRLRTIEKAAEFTTIEVPESFVNYSGTAAANVNNALSGVLQNSSVGQFMESAGLGVARVPLPFASIVGGAVRSGGRTMQDAAQRQSVNSVLNPYGSALRQMTDSNQVFQSGLGAGFTGYQLAPKDN